jgi:hypothetical protein
MAFSCFSFSSLTQSLFCISSWVAATRRSYRLAMAGYSPIQSSHAIHQINYPLYFQKVTVLQFFLDEWTPAEPTMSTNSNTQVTTTWEGEACRTGPTLTHSFCHFMLVSVTMPCSLASSLRLSENCRWSFWFWVSSSCWRLRLSSSYMVVVFSKISIWGGRPWWPIFAMQTL